MISGWMMRCLIVVYALLAGVSLLEGFKYRALYWVCAMGLTVSVLKGMK